MDLAEISASVMNKRTSRLTSPAHARGDALDGRSEGLLELGRGVFGSAHLLQDLGLEDVERVRHGLAEVVHALDHLIVREQLVAARHHLDALDRLLELREHARADRRQIHRHQHLLVHLGDGDVHLSENGLNQLDRRLEERPLRVHVLEELEVPVGDLGVESRPDAVPNRHVEARLGPGEHPGDSAERLDAAGLALAGARAEVEQLQLLLGRDGAEVVDEVGRLVDHRTVSVTPALRHPLHRVPEVLGRRRRGGKTRLEDGGGVALEGQLARAEGPEVVLDHLTLDGDAKAAGDGTRRLRLDREVLRASAAPDRPAAAVEEVEWDLVLGREAH
mmetsp:Transcript_3088/g.7225  ORF Transcript_3088/g.7225 Transcript_3088/m.7225 type:complete len:333 (+) Transcript_3088:218-1216(+)